MTWDEYKAEAKARDPVTKQILEQTDIEARVISAIIKRRNEMGLSQQEVAELCEISKSFVTRIESSKTMPKLDTLAKILAHLGLTVNITQRTE